MVTSSSTPDSILMEVIGLTISEGLCKSLSRWWSLIWKRSQVLNLHLKECFLYWFSESWQASELVFHFEILFLWASHQGSTYLFQDFTFQLLRVILIRWIALSGSTGVFPVSLKAMAAPQLPTQFVPRGEQTAVRQEQERDLQSPALAATDSTSKSHM